jgi:cardiolipin synthase A/B
MKSKSLTISYTSVGQFMLLAVISLSISLGHGQGLCEQVYSDSRLSQNKTTLDYSKVSDRKLIEEGKARTERFFSNFALFFSPKKYINEKLKQLEPENIKDLGVTGAYTSEKILLKLLAELSDRKLIRPMIEELITVLKTKNESLKELTPEKIEYVINTFMTNVEGLLSLRGMTKDSKKIKYLEWPELSADMISKLNRSPVGLENLLHFSKSNWSKASEIKLLVDGPQSFPLRDQLMNQAQKSIDVLSWAFNSDLTGFEAADLLIQKHKSGIKVRVIIDGQVSMGKGYNEAILKLEAAGVPVIRWRDTKLAFAGQHRKMIIVDNEHIIAGGLNFGDVYSHKNPDSNIPKWRDTDVYLNGEIVNQGNRLFAILWNEQIDSRSLKLQKIELTNESHNNRNTGSYDVALIDHSPTEKSVGSTIMMTLLKGIRESKQSIDLENAYIILFPALKQEIKRAVDRGVRVRIITNSAQSVDEPIVSIPMQRSARDFSALGAEVYLKKGATLHSKLAVFDNQYTMVMSYNLHPRSERVEGEMAIVIDSAEFARDVNETLENDVSSDNAIKISKPDEVMIPNSKVAIPMLRLFFDML